MFQAIENFFTDFGHRFYMTFINNDNYMLFLDGLKNTLLISLTATIIGCVLGILIAIVRSYYMQTKKLKLLNLICSAFVTFIRGTPVLVQLSIMYFIIVKATFTGVGFVVAMLTFGLNSSAYVSEIVRSGIMSIDKGQTEAGRSLGLSSGATMQVLYCRRQLRIYFLRSATNLLFC